MTDPPRWLDEGSDAPDEARALLRHARRSRGVDRATLIATAAAVAELGARPTIAVALAKLVALPQAVAALPVAAKVVTSLALVSAVAIVTAPTSHQPHARPRSAQVSGAKSAAAPRAQTPSAPAPVAMLEAPAVPVPLAPLTPPTSDAITEAPPSAARPRPRAQPVASVPRSDGTVPAQPPVDALAAEVAALDDARAELERSPALALRLADDHAARVPAATLEAERELIAIDALVHLGRRDEARTRAARLRARHPNGLYANRLSALLE